MEVTDSKFGDTEYPMIDTEASSSEWTIASIKAGESFNKGLLHQCVLIILLTLKTFDCWDT